MDNINSQDLAMELADYTHYQKISELFIDRIREGCNGTLPLPLPIESVAKIAGIEKISYQENLPFEGMLILENNTVVVNKSSNKRERFTIGHEIGHFLIPHHRLKKISFSCNKKDTSSYDTTGGIESIEVEANKFASAILMPKKEFCKAVSGKDFCMSEMVKISEVFNTSVQATCIRYKEVTGMKILFILSKNYQIQKFLGKGFDRLSVSIKIGGPIPPRSVTARTEVKLHGVVSENGK